MFLSLSVHHMVTLDFATVGYLEKKNKHFQKEKIMSLIVVDLG